MSEEISKPMEEATGIPSWATDLAMMVGGTALGFKTPEGYAARAGAQRYNVLSMRRGKVIHSLN